MFIYLHIFTFTILLFADFGFLQTQGKMDTTGIYNTNIYEKGNPIKTESSTIKNNEKTCSTKNCKISATLILESMNKSVDPCEDFYYFACGNYNKFYSQTLEMLLVNQISVKKFLEKEDSDTDPSSVRKSRLLYRSCKAGNIIHNEDYDKLKKDIDDFNSKKFNYNTGHLYKNKDLSLSKILARLKKTMNINYLFDISIESDIKNKNVSRISLRKPAGSSDNVFPLYIIKKNIRKMGSIHESYPSDEKVNIENNREINEEVRDFQSYKSLIQEVKKKIFGVEPNSPDDHEQDGLGLFNAHKNSIFDKNLSIIKKTVFDTDDQDPTFMTIDELQTLTDASIPKTIDKNTTIDWQEYLSIAFVEEVNVTLGLKPNSIIIHDIKYFKALFKLLNEYDYNEISIYIWNNFVTTLFPIRKDKTRYNRDINISSDNFCQIAVNKIMRYAVSRLFLDNEVFARNNKTVFDMMKNIHWAFEKIVNELEWMDDTSKNETLNKASLIKTRVGFPEFIKDAKQLDDYYSDFEVIETDFLHNVNNYKKLELFDNWYIHGMAPSIPAKIQASSNWIHHNSIIIISAGILQYPFIGHDLQALNYGFIGHTLGHELTHGFRIGAIYLDRLTGEKWWTDQSIENYIKLAECFIQHYESYTEPEILKKVNGRWTLDENIADCGGLREAFLAYKKYVDNHGEEPKLPGLEEFSNEQMFYLGYAHKNCVGLYDNELLPKDDLPDEHSPSYLRVVGALKNSAEFSKVWKCKKGSKMNPNKEKCIIW